MPDHRRYRIKPTLPILVAIILAALIDVAQALTPVPTTAEARYVKRVEARFADFAGSSGNLASIVGGLRGGSEFTISDRGKSVAIVPPTKPMGYGNITRSLDLASRELALHGITNPTPVQIAAALNGGTVTTVNGPVTLTGVLQLRSQGMGWGQIAHTLNLHPGLGSGGSSPAPASASTPAQASGVTTALGTRAVQPGVRNGAGQSNGSVSAAGSAGGIGQGSGAGHGRGGKI